MQITIKLITNPMKRRSQSTVICISLIETTNTVEKEEYPADSNSYVALFIEPSLFFIDFIISQALSIS